MVDVQDIDALLIGALYGELTPADEARLAAHLESHPTDRTALDQLTHARGLVKPYLTELVDPPQAISALLLQEAARRAPRKVSSDHTESWFQRFVRSFMAHPAMAAAAMLVLVIGVAGTMYVRHGDQQFASEQAPASAQLDRQQELAGKAPATPVVPSAAEAGSAAPAFGADLVEQRKELAVAGDKGAERMKTESKPDAPVVAAATPKKSAPPASHSGITVKAPQAEMPKELDESATDPASIAADDGFAKDSRRGAPGGVAQGNAAPPPAPAPTQAVARERPDTSVVAGATGGEGQSPMLAWAKDQHARMQAYVKAGDCRTAAALGVDVATRAPEYYAQTIANDRALKACMPAITTARDQEAEKSQKARAQKRVNANEPAPADSLK